jgi:tight adherence protein B
MVSRATHSAAMALVLSGLAGAAPYMGVRYAARRRIDKFEEFFPEALDLITRALKAGHAFTTGLSMVGEEMPDPVGMEFRLLYERQNFGAPIEQAMRSFAERVPLLDAKFFVTAVLTQRESGGNLSEVLENLASVIRDRFKVKREVRTKSAHGRMTGWVLAGVPPSMALAMFIVSPEVMRTMVTDPLGVRMITVGVVLQVIGTWIIRRLVRIDY